MVAPALYSDGRPGAVREVFRALANITAIVEAPCSRALTASPPRPRRMGGHPLDIDDKGPATSRSERPRGSLDISRLAGKEDDSALSRAGRLEDRHRQDHEREP